MIKILLADDSMLIRAVLRDALNAAEGMVVVGEATTGSEAITKTEQLRPDIIVMDIMMPVMDGLAATEAIMARCPTPILILSATVNDKGVNLAFTALKKGALDVMGKPNGGGAESQHEFISRLVDKIRLLVRVRVIHHLHRGKEFRDVPLPVLPGSRDILAIGASTGGPKAVMSIVKALPAGFSAAIFIVQHISSGFAKGFAQWLDLECSLPVRLAAAGDVPSPGQALVAPNDCHMLLEKGVISLSNDPPVNSCRPSIDVFFNSLAAARAERVVGVLLTGMGKDGAQGLGRIREQGGVTIAQDEKSCAVFGMPKAAIGMNAASKILPLNEIPENLKRLFPH